MPTAPRRDGPAGAAEESVPFLEYCRILRQRRTIVLASVALVLAAGVLVTLLATPRYTATTTIEIERQAPEILEFKDVLGVDPAGYNDFYQTQYRILQSRTVLRTAIERIDLPHDPRFASRRRSPLQRFGAWTRETLRGAPTGGDALEPAMRFVEDGLGITPVRNSHLVHVSFTDRDAALAAELANAVTDGYQAFQLQNRYDTTGQAKEFLAKDAARVRDEIGALQRKLQEYGAAEEILGLADDTRDISEQALAELNDRSTEARVELARAEARLSSVDGSAAGALPDVHRSATVVTLNDRRDELERRRDLLAEKFAPGWPALVEVERELATAREQLSRTVARLAENVRAAAEADVRRARSEVERLERQRDAQKREVLRVNFATIEYASLKSEIETKREVLRDLVERQSETETSYRLKDTAASNVRVVDRAEIPTRASSPRSGLNLAMSLVFGIALGVGMAFLADQLDNSIKHEHDITRVADLPILGHLPLVPGLRALGGKTAPGDAAPGALDLASHVDSRSSFAEAFKNLRTSLLLATPEHPPQHISVTSCEPGDGKSTVALNLAIVLTQLGKRVLLIDADLRRARLHRVFELSNRVGLSNYLCGASALDEVVQATAVPNLDFIPSGPIPPNPSELLGAPALKELLVRIGRGGRYDHLVFDTPPVLSVTDAVVLSTRMDTTVLVVRADVTSRDALRHGAARLRDARSTIVGTVLNGVSAKAGYYHDRYSGYYRDAEDVATPAASPIAVAAPRGRGRRQAG